MIFVRRRVLNDTVRLGRPYHSNTQPQASPACSVAAAARLRPPWPSSGPHSRTRHFISSHPAAGGGGSAHCCAQPRSHPSTVTIDIKEPDSTVTIDIKEPDSTVTIDIKEPDSTVTIDIKEPDSTVTIDIKEPDSTVTIDIKEPDSMASTRAELSAGKLGWAVVA